MSGVAEHRELVSVQTLQALGEVRAAWGAGVCVRLGRLARLELNYVMPLCAQPRDRHICGMQFGVGANFL